MKTKLLSLTLFALLSVPAFAGDRELPPNSEAKEVREVRYVGDEATPGNSQHNLATHIEKYKDGEVTTTRAWADVISVEPVYSQRYATAQQAPGQICQTEQVRNSNMGGHLMGAALGGAIGHQFGRGHRSRNLSTFAGAIIGSQVLTTSNPGFHEVTSCHPNPGYSSTPVSPASVYRVIYAHNGHHYETITNQRPGYRILVEETVRTYQ